MESTLSSVDTAWYRLDSPNDPADIIGVLIFDGQVDYDRLRATIETRFLHFERFRQRIDDSGIGRPQWRDDPEFSLDDHLQRIELPEPADRAALQDKIGELMNSPLDKRKPLWRIYLVDNYEEGSALIAQLHHCMGDGFALAHVLLRLADHDPDAPWPSHSDIEEVRAGEDVHEHRWFRDVVLDKVEDLAKHPSHATDMAKKVQKTASALGHLVMMPFDPPTMLKREPTGQRRVSWSDGISLQRVKDIAHGFGGTVNDVLMAALTGAYRRYLIERGDNVDDRDIRALVPVNLRPVRRVEDMPDELGNHFGLVFLTLPVTEATAAGRLRRVKECMDELKKSPEAFILFEVFNLAGHTPEMVEHLVADTFGKKASTVVTNVPGPREPLYLGGREVTDLMFWAPHPARLGSNASIISYNGVVRVGVRGDENVLPDPEKVVGYFDEEFDGLENMSDRKP
ncbi:WS/DGAT/MGAT family O-acyltransferase [Persicimonas caeni]|nr:wax ester/triacylglycerol synthase family O-acyltransferase [Persicimonas caeni]